MERFWSFFAAVCLAAVYSLGMSAPASAHVGSHLPVDGKVRIVTLKLTDYHKQLGDLVKSGFDVAGVNLKNKTVDVVLNSEGFKYLPAELVSKMESYKEIDTEAAPDAGYKTPAQVEAFLKKFAADFPDLVTVESIGKTAENRDIWAAKITSQAKGDSATGKPTILFNAMHHAREVMTVEVAYDTIDYLTKNYSSDTKVRGWVDNNVIWVVPMVNPDGSNKVWTANSMWRKNNRGGYGVDINRNYPYRWGGCNGSSGSTFADDYRGAAAGSEQETKALMGLVGRVQPVFDISYHSYSELVIYPFGCDGVHTPSGDVVESTGKQMAGLLPTESGRGTYDPGTSWELLYSVDGGDIDWMYDQHQVIPYVIEMNSTSLGFQPSYNQWRTKTVTKMRAAWQFLLDKLDASGIRGVVKDSNGQALANATVLVHSLGRGAEVNDRTYKVKIDGTFHIVLLPGMYRLTISAGGQTHEQDFVVGQERVDADVVL